LYNLTKEKVFGQHFYKTTDKTKGKPFSLRRAFLMPKKTLLLARAGIIASLYVVLSFVTFPISGGAIQFRIAEGLTLLPLFFIESVPALFVGCMLFNLISGLPVYDVVFGSLITLVAGVCTWGVGKTLKNKCVKIIVGGIFPVLFNAFFLPVIWYFCYGQLEFAYILSVLSLLISQALSVYAVGTFLSIAVSRLKDKKVKFFD
jgi:uncharacterized membrane protein